MYPKIYIDLFRSFDRTPEIFVAMPFSPQFETRWKEIFVPAIKSCDIKPYRTKELLVSNSIPVDILNGIGRTKFLLFDISNEGKDRPNSNVMYELGIAHAIRLPEEVIIVRDEQSESCPFDIKHIRWNNFSTKKIEESRAKIEKLIRNAEKQFDLTKDLMVKNALSSLDFEMISFLDTVRKYDSEGFDLYPFDLDRKGLYALPHKECSEEYLRKLARDLINLRIIKSAGPISIKEKIYGGTPEYYFTEFGKVILSKIPIIQK